MVEQLLVDAAMASDGVELVVVRSMNLLSTPFFAKD